MPSTGDATATYMRQMKLSHLVKPAYRPVSHLRHLLVPQYMSRVLALIHEESQSTPVETVDEDFASLCPRCIVPMMAGLLVPRSPRQSSVFLARRRRVDSAGM